MSFSQISGLDESPFRAPFGKTLAPEYKQTASRGKAQSCLPLDIYTYSGEPSFIDLIKDSGNCVPVSGDSDKIPHYATELYWSYKSVEVEWSFSTGARSFAGKEKVERSTTQEDNKLQAAGIRAGDQDARLFFGTVGEIFGNASTGFEIQLNFDPVPFFAASPVNNGRTVNQWCFRISLIVFAVEKEETSDDPRVIGRYTISGEEGASFKLFGKNAGKIVSTEYFETQAGSELSGYVALNFGEKFPDEFWKP